MDNSILLPFPDSQEEMDSLANSSLSLHGLESTDENRALFGSAIQQLVSQSQDLKEEEVIKFVRRMRTLKFAYLLVHPEKRQPETTDGPEIKEVASAVVSEA